MLRRQRRCLPLRGITPKSVLEHLLFAVIGGVMYMQIAGACSRTQAAVLGTAMLVCMAICYADLCAAKRRRAAEEVKARKAARVSMDKAAHIAYRADLMRQIR